MLNHTDIEAFIVQLISERVQKEDKTIGLDANLADLGIDSLDIVEIIFAIEEKYNIEIPFNANSSAAADLATPKDVIAAVCRLVLNE